MRITQGQYSFLPDLSDERIAQQIEYAIDQRWALIIEYTDDPDPRNSYWETWGLPLFDPDPAEVLSEIAACRAQYRQSHIRLNAFDKVHGRDSPRMSFLIHRPPAARGQQ